MCTGVRFCDDKGNMYFGRNLDWTVGYGQGIVVTPREYSYTSAFLGEMQTKYALIGMAIIQENIPLYFDCGNEAGLAIAALNFPGYAEYEPSPVEGKTNLAIYEFLLWVAMNFSTVAEVEEALKNVAIVDKPINAAYPAPSSHWLIGDAQRSIVVEYTKDGMQVFANEVDVLTNQPGYGWHRENLRNYLNISNRWPEGVKWHQAELTAFGTGGLMHGLPGDYYAPSRFVRVAYLNANYPVQTGEAANVARLFHTLAGVSMVEGAAATASGEFEKTIYTGGYSAATQTYYWNTYENPAIQKAALGDFDITGSALMQQ